MPGPMGPRGRNSTDRPKNFKETTKKLINSYLSKYKIALLIVFIFAIGSTIFTIVGPKILGNATTEVFNGIIGKLSGGSGIDFGKIGGIALTLLALYIVSAIFAFIQGFTMTSVSQKITYKLRNDIAEKINKLPMKYFDSKKHGEVLSIITNDIDTLSMNLNQSITQIITSVCTLIGILIMMFSISWQMTIISLVILPIAGLLVKIIVGKSQKYFQNQQAYLANVNGQVEEIYSGLNIVKAFNGEEKVVTEFEKANKLLYKSGWKSQFLSGLIHPVINFVSNIGYVGVAVAGGILAVNGTITVGNIQSFIQYNKQFTQPINQIAQISAMLQAMVAAAERIFEFLEQEEEIDTKKGEIDTEKLKGNVTFNHVKFGYNPEEIIIKDFNSTVKEGQKIAIVGPTGAGKTTMVKLLMRFYDVTEGEILVDGHNVKDFERGELRRMFGMVLQDTWLFGGTVKENIKYGNENATDDEVIQAAKAAHVHHFIKTLPNGYNSVLNEESSNVSAGQKQLLTIARVILADPKILILDEATSSIDTRTEIQIQDAMDNLMKGRTSFIIAHRLSTIKNADLILVMDHGDIVEQGTHEELLEKDGFYAVLYNSQFDEEERRIKMTIEEELFRKTKIDFNKISKYGFKKDKSLYKYSKNIMDDTFRVDIEIDSDGIVKGKVYDLSFGDEYTNFRIEDITGSFVGQVKDEFKNLLKDIRNNCFIREAFIYEQSNRITKAIKEKYGDEPEFEWKRFPEYATFRNKDSKKWYGIIMNLNKNKLDEKSTGEVEIIDIKLEPNEIEYLLKQDGFYPAYHMNKKSWITVILNNTISDEKIMNLIEKSYSYTIVNKNSAKNEWIVPANPIEVKDICH